MRPLTPPPGLPDPACAGLSPEVQAQFFPSDAEADARAEKRDHTAALALCNRCPGARRTFCGQEGQQYNDFTTVRAGYKLWIPSERLEFDQEFPYHA